LFSIMPMVRPICCWAPRCSGSPRKHGMHAAN
jgi:hypothetical protein